MFFTVLISHPDGPEWGQHVHDHVAYLEAKVTEGKIRASGQVVGRPLRSGMFIADVADRTELDTLIAGDPFAREGLIADCEITEWRPFIGIFKDEVERPTF